MKIYNLDTKRFMKRVAQSKGEVYLHLPDGNLCNIKQDSSASALFGSMEKPEEGIEFTFSDTHDASFNLRYLI